MCIRDRVEELFHGKNSRFFGNSKFDQLESTGYAGPSHVPGSQTAVESKISSGKTNDNSKILSNPTTNFDQSDVDTNELSNLDKIPWNSWDDYEKLIQNGQEYAKVGDRLYSRHAVDRMQPSGRRYTVGGAIIQVGGVDGRSIAPQYVERCV